MNLEQYKKWYLSDGTVKSEDELVQLWFGHCADNFFWKSFYGKMYKFTWMKCGGGDISKYFLKKGLELKERKIHKLIREYIISELKKEEGMAQKLCLLGL